MKHNIFKYIAISAALLATAVNAGAQYNIDNGVGTSKTVTGPNTDGYYTIRLETFATGTTTVTETAKPVDVVLVLDVSGSMDFPKGTYTAETKAFTYNDIANSEYTYFYRRENNGEVNYWKVYARHEGNNYDLYYYPGSPRRIGSARNDPDTPVTQYHQGGWFNDPYYDTMTLYRGTETRMDALKTAVGAFIDEIEAKDHTVVDGVETRVGHRISIIKFAGNTTNTVGNTTYPDGNAGNSNYTQIVMNLTEVAGHVDDMKAAVNGFQSMGGTQAGYGMAHANTVLANQADPDHSKVVVFFTDGNPDDSYAAIGSSSGNNGQGTNAYRAKNAQDAVVYTIGMFSTSPSTTSDTYKYLNNVSSNYPKATVNNGTMSAGEGSDQGYYQDASGDVSLTKIFTSISQGIGGAEATVGTSTQVRDVVTNSFVLPNDVSAADVKVYTSTATGAADGADDEDPESWTTPVALTSVTTNIVNVDANGQPTTDPDKVKNKALIVQGFDYSKADSAEGEGDGNWVGPRFKNNKWTWAGKKVIIEFKVKADGQATGGESQTNTSNSGVWVQGDDGTYTCVNHYAEPHTTLTVNIKIRKTGLRSGESATFELMRIRPKGYNPDGATNADKVANLEYNLIGKPKPGTHESTNPALSPDDPDPSKYYESIGWKSFKKVILTNLSDTDGAEVIKDVLALDPYWVYMVVEDDWGWSYEMSGDANQVGEDGTYTTSTVEVNPFRFHNTEKTNVVKHAEAVMVNHFQSVEEGASSYTEHKKSSKVEHF